MQPGTSPKGGADAFSMKAGPRGTLLIVSTAYRKTPLAISLHGVDGRTLAKEIVTMTPGGNRTWDFGNDLRAQGAYIVKISGPGVNLSKRIAIAK